MTGGKSFHSLTLNPKSELSEDVVEVSPMGKTSTTASAKVRGIEALSMKLPLLGYTTLPFMMMYTVFFLHECWVSYAES
jgi:hypothetical protein